MPSQNNAKALKKVDSFVAGVKNLGTKGADDFFKLCLKHYGETIIPLLTVEDGGLSRGKFFGMLRKMGVTLPEAIMRDKTLVSNEKSSITTEKVSEGIREGMRINKQRTIVRLLDVDIYQANHNKMFPLLRNLRKFRAVVLDFFKRKLSNASV